MARTATIFSESVVLVSQYASDRYFDKLLPERDLHRINTALWILNSLAESETHVYDFGPSAIKQQQTSGSLLSAMAEMFFRDLLAGRRGKVPESLRFQ